MANAAALITAADRYDDPGVFTVPVTAETCAMIRIVALVSGGDLEYRWIRYRL
jgi:hypothetical protein